MKKDNWIIKVFIMTFFIALFFNSISNVLVNKFDNLIILTILAILFIGIGILFDIIGIAITVADVKTFNSMATKRVRGANIAVKLIKHNEKASSFCNDVIGDICGIISGSAGVVLSTIISTKLNVDILVVTLVVTGVIAALTIGGKAIGKHLAINKSTVILFNFSKVLSLFYYGK